MPQRHQHRQHPPNGGARRRTRAVHLALLLVFCALFLLPTGAPATVAEQRARLPPPAEDCEDEVAGKWRSHSFWQGQQQWYIFTLEVHRVPGDESKLTGVVYSHFWNGSPDEEQPPACRSGLNRQIVKMPAKGQVKDGVITFGGTSWKTHERACGHMFGSYYPDVFTGRIDSELQEFQSVNNDGGPAVNVPTVFRRIGCAKPLLEPAKVKVKAPSFQPPAKQSGCSWF